MKSQECELTLGEGKAKGQIGKFAECTGDLSYVQNACVAVFVSPNNSFIVSFCCFTKISWLEPQLKFKVSSRENRPRKANFPIWGQAVHAGVHAEYGTCTPGTLNRLFIIS